MKTFWKILSAAAVLAVSCGGPRVTDGSDNRQTESGPGGSLDTRTEISADPAKAGNFYYIYDDCDEAPMTKPPRGYKPFYISHLGRHGARWGLLYQYDTVMNALARAEKAGALTPRGEKLLRDYRPFYERASLMEGELTGKGARQLKSIAARMYRRFPEVFRGPTRGTAIATTVPRVIMSMENTVEELHRQDPSLDIDAAASNALLEVLTPNVSTLDFTRPLTVREIQKPAWEWQRDSVDIGGITSRLFTRPEAAGTDLSVFTGWLHAIKCSVLCLDDPQEDMFEGLFTPEEEYALAKAYGYRILSYLGNIEGSGTLYPVFSAYTLKDILNRAQEDIASGETQLRLRFTHDSALLPMIVLMDIDGLGKQTSGPDDSYELFPLYKVPMASSLQFVFFRNGKGDILLKVLFNEREATLPLEPVSGPYYRWSDVLEHYGGVIGNALAEVDSAREAAKLFQK
jgi:hypothetical protein